ncbi:hypothetical protein QZH41_001897 [Actinostola sp. cb2023]|nr:hypothetical protein QZH41_001897 [Actinostola sp. cb2023]
MLKDFYEELVEQEKPIAIVFVSSDRSEEDMNTYFQGDHGDWYVVPFGSTLAQTLKKNCNVSGIPMLVVVNNDGKMVHGDGRNDVTSGNPAAAFQKWKELPITVHRGMMK